MKQLKEINPVELHICSYVQTKEHISFGVDSITHTNTEWFIGGNEKNYNANEIFPIILDEKWLELLGFAYEEEDEWWVDGFTDNTSLFCIELKGEKQYCFKVDEFIIVDLIYVHQLQNLYFAVRNEVLLIRDE